MALFLYLLTTVALLWTGSRMEARLTWKGMVILFLMPLCFTGSALLTGAIYAPVDLAFQADPLKPLAAGLGVSGLHNGTLGDVYSQMIPWRSAVRFALAHGQWPLWNPFMFTGDILAAAAQPAPYYPFNLLGLLLPLADSLTYLAATTYLVAALAALLFLLSIGCSEEAACLGAAGWMYCDFIAFWQAWPLGVSASLLPLICYGVRKIVDVPGVRSAAVLTSGFVILIFAGHPETVLHVVAVGAVWGLFELSRIPIRNWTAPALSAVTSGGCALLITAGFLLPILEALPQTAEYSYRQEVYAVQDHSAPWTTVAARLLRDALPYVHGPQGRESVRVPASYRQAGNAYCGSLVFGLAAFATWKSRRRERWFMVALVIFGALAGAAARGVTSVLQRLPLFDIALNERLWFAASFGLIVLAALGLEAAATHSDVLPRMFLLTAVVIALLTAVSLDEMVVWDLSAGFILKSALASLVPLLIAAAIVWRLGFTGRVSLAILFLLLLQRTVEMGDFYPTVPRRAFFPSTPELEAIPRDQVARMTSRSFTFIPNVSALYGLEDVRGYQGMNFRRLLETYSLWTIPQPIHYNRIDDIRPFLSFLNVRYLLTPLNSLEPGWPLVKRGPSMALLENPKALERAFVPSSVRTGARYGEVVDEMARETDFGARSWIEAVPDAAGRWQRSAGQAGERGPIELPNGPGRVRVSRQGSSLLLEASMQNAGWVVVSQTGWKGWQAREGNREIPLFFANHAFLAFHLPAGDHRVSLFYRPDSFVVGMGISGATILALTLGAVLLGVRRRVRRGAPLPGRGEE